MKSYCLATCFLLASAAPINFASAQTHYPLPLGPAGLYEQDDTTTLAPGLTLTHIVRGQVDSQDGYAVDVPFNTDQTSVQALAAALTQAGFSPEIINIHPPQGARPGFFGAVVRLGVFATQALANELVQSLMAHDFKNITTVYTGYNGFKTTTGPWVVNVVDLDPSVFHGSITPVRSAVPEGRETTSSIAQRTDAVVAINGGYFVIGTADGTPGAPVGISAIGGDLYHEATKGRSTIGFLPSGQSYIDRYQTAIYVTDGAGTFEQAFGLNRRPGIQRDCGGPKEELPSNEPRQDFNCTLADDLVVFTPPFGSTTDSGPATMEVVLDANNRMVSVANGGNVAIPADGLVLAAMGKKATWLAKYAKLGESLSVFRGIFTSFGLYLPPESKFNVVNGGPGLVQNGKVNISAISEGFAYAQPDNSNEYYGFGLSRNPRTLAGRTKNGHLLLVTIDGRQPGYSVGASFDESALLMKSLGSEQATNLDGGGSTAIAVNGKLFNKPSDATGERPVGEVIIIRSY